MADPLDFFNEYIMGSIQMLFGFYFFARLLHKKIKFYIYLLFAVCAILVIHFGSTSSIAEFGTYVLLLTAAGCLIFHADYKSAVLYAALVVEVMQLGYGIVNSLLSALYPFMSSFDQNLVGIIFMLSGDLSAFILTGFCCHMIWRYFSYYEAIKKQYMFLVLVPILMIFIMEEYINSVIYGMVVTDSAEITVYTNHYQILGIQLLGMANLFCILFAYKKLLQNFRLSTELSLLEQEEHSLNRYVEEAKTRYEKTVSFRHDIKNHIAVIKKLLQSGTTEQALNYIGDMEGMAEDLSLPCSTNNPVVDILAGQKFGIAKSMGIDIWCSLRLPCPCGLRDIDLCIILSNALDNAIHACTSMEAGAEKYISVKGRIQGDFLFLEIENSFQGKALFRKGTGLSNIKAVAEKYHGAISVKTQGNVFSLNVLLIIPQHPKDILQRMG
ncbi:MAG: GHKL domain-containing protein [Lachnospiraceae bacterium]|nr:GHKL domain-containing protein [Lachnospiraceae bacterium]